MRVDQLKDPEIDLEIRVGLSPMAKSQKLDSQSI
jgi:hypothetical protein